MSETRRAIRVTCLLITLFLLHLAIGTILSIRGYPANLALTALLVSSLYGNSVQGCKLGLCMGLLEASFAARFVGSIIVSRVLIGFAVGSLEERLFRDNVVIAIITAFVGTLLAEGLFYLIAPQPHVVRWFTSVGVEACLNTLLAIIIYPLFHIAVKNTKQPV